MQTMADNSTGAHHPVDAVLRREERRSTVTSLFLFPDLSDLIQLPADTLAYCDSVLAIKEEEQLFRLLKAGQSEQLFG
jgi:hypothetical protein